MVIASSSCYRGEWPNCTFAVNLLPSLKLILQSQIIKDEYPQYLTCTVFPFTWRNRLEIGALEKSVAIVKCGPNWGTGILVDEQSGTFVTCAHVLTTAPNTIVQFATMTSIASCKRRSEWFAEGKLIYKTPDNQPYDIAVLRIDSKFEKPPMKAIKLADRPARKGEQVLSIAFPFSSKGRSPTITSGIVSKTLSCMLQTNCCIQNGVSGGPIVRRTDFQMLGLIVCNAASTNGSISYPKLCMAIPINVLRGPLNNYLRTNDPQTLQDLTQHDQNVVATWNLRPFLPSSI
ncbi:PREDICTED: peroxisomal leader peptide-processing protease-like [Habropoda laboriosa]|nr:PREDICTED: peroxisomal leader peptide-processing protease-like [Habropoda laboriosa]